MSEINRNPPSQSKQQSVPYTGDGFEDSHGKPSLEDSHIFDSCDIEPQLKVDLSKLMEEKLLKIRKELKSEIEKFNKPCEDEMTGLKDQIRKLVEDEVALLLKAAFRELNENERMEEVREKTSKISNLQKHTLALNRFFIVLLIGFLSAVNIGLVYLKSTPLSKAS